MTLVWNLLVQNTVRLCERSLHVTRFTAAKRANGAYVSAPRPISVPRSPRRTFTLKPEIYLSSVSPITKEILDFYLENGLFGPATNQDGESGQKAVI